MKLREIGSVILNRALSTLTSFLTAAALTLLVETAHTGVHHPWLVALPAVTRAAPIPAFRLTGEHRSITTEMRLEKCHLL